MPHHLKLAKALVLQAEMLILQQPESEVFRRRAISTAYYGVFHGIAEVCATSLLSDESQKDLNIFGRVYRSLEHGSAKDAFKNRAALTSNVALGSIGSLFGGLQEARHRADYAPLEPSLFSLDQAKQFIGEARFMLDNLQKLEDKDRTILATCLLFKERKT